MSSDSLDSAFPPVGQEVDEHAFRSVKKYVRLDGCGNVVGGMKIPGTIISDIMKGYKKDRFLCHE